MYIASFYRFTNIVELEHIHEYIECLCRECAVQGTVLLATEGINATLAHRDINVLKAIIDQLETNADFSKLRPTFSRAHAGSQPFDKLQVKIRAEIVTYGTQYDFALPKLPRAKPAQWADLVRQKDTVVLDVRNQYEHTLGSFRNSIHPNTQNFREFKDFLQHQTDIDHEQTVVMYCTGGIRCEKAAQSMHKSGFKSVVQLEGGILGYLEETQDHSLWKGECFVFDQRVAVNRTLMEGTAKLCLACGGPLRPVDMTSSLFSHGISCPWCSTELSSANLARRTERLRQLHLSRQREVNNSRAHDAAIRACPA